MKQSSHYPVRVLTRLCGICIGITLMAPGLASQSEYEYQALQQQYRYQQQRFDFEHERQRTIQQDQYRDYPIPRTDFDYPMHTPHSRDESRGQGDRYED